MIEQRRDEETFSESREKLILKNISDWRYVAKLEAGGASGIAIAMCLMIYRGLTTRIGIVETGSEMWWKELFLVVAGSMAGYLLASSFGHKHVTDTLLAYSLEKGLIRPEKA